MKVTEIPLSKMKILPPAPNTCQTCGRDHASDLPHDQQSLYWQYSFYQKHNRWPTWHDAMEHCTPEMKKRWISELTKLGVKL